MVADGKTPAAADAFQRAVACHRSERWQEAEQLYKSVLKSHPDHPDANHNLGLLAFRFGHGQPALDLIHRAIAVRGDMAAYRISYCEVLQALKRPEEARDAANQGLLSLYAARQYKGVEDLARRVIQWWPEEGLGWKALGTTLCMQGKPLEALEFLERAAQLLPQSAEIFNNLGNACRTMGRQDEALDHYRRAIALNPSYGDALTNLAGLLKEMCRVEESLAVFRQAMAVCPDNPALHNVEGGTYADSGQLDKAFASYRRALEIDPRYLPAYNNLLLGYQYHPDLSPEFALEEAKRFGATVSGMASPYTHWPNDRGADKRLKVGLVSGDLGAHPVGRFLQGILGKVDTAKLEIFAYSNRDKPDDSITRIIKRHVPHWRDVYGIADETLARMVRSDGIDILIDLAGHTGGNRLSLFAWKAAPIQVAWLGYFATTGVDAIDYILADRWVLPPEEESHFVEKPWRMPDAYYCYTPPVIPAKVAPLPALQTGHITFGCFNNLTKVSDAVIACWSEILLAVPDARLFLKAKQLRDEDFRASLLKKFADLGVAGERLTLEQDSRRKAYLTAFNQVDIALDPFPFPGGATTVEGLWMGVPVITLQGQRYIAHQGETILHAAGLDAWIARDIDDYVAKAVGFSKNIDGLARLRAGLRKQVLSSPIYDTRRFAINFEQALRGMWQAWLDSQASPVESGQ